ncbi:UDP-N-acetylmuramoyl-L-alanine--D-glutamate ligase [Sandarakinorhabdus limnophila]|jgi:UDP-N-acetylmuramoylalanine--D-glutamate ligase|uniref:UDP-N-acetylmuramoyl-L-alanine--D-glutamate ligase n=1 Tax=Sandarakinorhabdus limnophila TaxID=210512 RepID=UPI0026EA800B|nr:UDP-N-acetylmuramoyl-L-alanine--D-glutamate ligase [Sandarakinorhabdus limnophila]
MITSPAFAGKRWGVLGLARTGRAVAAALAASGGEVWAWDDGEAAQAGHKGTLVDLNTADLSGLAGIVVSPGVPHSAPIFAAAARYGVPVIGDPELFALSQPAARIVGITGTNGKSTTTALLHHLCTTAGIPAAMGGNIGLPIMAQEPLPAGGVWVLELSSYQLEITHSLACDVAILTNITPDHLERHGTMAAYADAKARLFAMQKPGSVAIVGKAAQAAWSVASGPVLLIEDVALPSPQSDWPALKGPHNLENARAAIAAARALGIADNVIARGLATYQALAHRMEPMGEKRGLLWVNDSKATNADSTSPALTAYPRIHWIAGGRPKLDANGKADLSAILPHLGGVVGAYLIGEAAPKFAEQLQGQVPLTQSGTLAQAMADVLAAAKPGEVVLFSPAAASFDQYKDFEDRGAAFRAAVAAL